MKTYLSSLVAALCLGAFGCDSQKPATPEVPATAIVPKPPEPIQKPHKASNSYSVKVDAPNVRVGESGKIRVEIRPGSGFKINTEYPWKIEVPASDQVKLASSKFDKSKFELSKKLAAVTLDATVDSAGDHTLTAVASFSVCNDDVCKNLRDEPIEIAFQAVP